MVSNENPLDGIANELFGWMDSEVSYYVDALKGGPNGRAPFAADVSQKQLHDIYTRQMFTQNPDGSIDYTKPNPEGRSKLMARVGPQKYAEVWDAVRPKQGRRPEVSPEPEEEELEVPE